MPATTKLLTGSDFIQNSLVTGGRQWTNDVTYSIAQTDSVWGEDYRYSGYPTADYGVLTGTQYDVFRGLMEVWDGFYGFSLTETNDLVSPGDIRIAFTRAPGNYAGWAPSYVGDPIKSYDGDIWLRASTRSSSFSPVEDPAAHEALMRAIGRALGLNDWRFSGAGGTRFSVMADDRYQDSNYIYVTPDVLGPQLSARYVPPTTPMAYDVFTLLVLSNSKPPEGGAGDTTYTFSEHAPFMMSITDASGVDTIDLSTHLRGSAIDLTMGAYSSIAYYSAAQQATDLSAHYPSLVDAIAQRFAQSDVYTWSLNLSIGYKSIIENVHGGSGSDSIWGNEVANVLRGGGGQDYLRGGDGGDLLEGGADFDDLHGNLGADTVRGGEGGDWVVGGQGADVLLGQEGADVVYGNLGGDYQEGGAGNDWVRGGQGDDVLLGEDGDDFIAGDRGNDTLYGGAGADLFHAFTGSEVDLIADFDASEGDRVNLLEGTIHSVAQVGADVVVDLNGTGRVVLTGVQLTSLPPDWLLVS